MDTYAQMHIRVKLLGGYIPHPLRVSAPLIGGFTMGVPPQTGSLQFKVFNLLSWTHENFKKSKYKLKIKFDKIWVNQNGGPPKRDRQNQTFQPLMLNT